MRLAPERREHLLDRAILHPRPPARLTLLLLQLIEAFPIGVGEVMARSAMRRAARTLPPVRLRGRKHPALARSSSMHVTDSTESGLLVPTTPLGPRLIQPEVYSPTTGCLRLRIDHAAASR